ncbi:hypothetical protein DFQ26_007547 [Actinomortierella ambigua]|nr:hypothetical protein DFQ26_007547 [Actinomortierella ambigua]
MSNSNNSSSSSSSNNIDSPDDRRRLASWSSQPVDKNEYRHQLAQHESVGAGLFYAAAAGVAGSALVARSRSVPVKILTPLTMAALTANYFLPAHSDYYLHNLGRPLRIGKADAVDLRHPSSLGDLKREAANVGQDISQEVGATWESVKSKVEGLADTSRAVGKEELSKLAQSQSAKEAKFWLDQQRAEMDDILGREETTKAGAAGAAAGASGLFGLKSSSSSSSSETMGQQLRRQDDLDDTLKPDEHWWSRKRDKETRKREEAAAAPPPPAAGAYNLFGWWRADESAAGNPELEIKMVGSREPMTKTDREAYVDRKLQEANVSNSKTTASSPPRRRRPSNADLHVAKEAVRGHDAAVTRGAMLGRVDAEETGRKVHDNVIDATVPRHRQTRHEPHGVEETRTIYEKGGKKSQRKGDAHGLENLDKRAHMIKNGVEHLEHSINRKMQKILQDEADFWHDMALKDEERLRTLNEQASNARGERAF